MMLYICFRSRNFIPMDLFFLDNFEKNDKWHDKIKNIICLNQPGIFKILAVTIS